MYTDPGSEHSSVHESPVIWYTCLRIRTRSKYTPPGGLYCERTPARRAGSWRAWRAAGADGGGLVEGRTAEGERGGGEPESRERETGRGPGVTEQRHTDALPAATPDHESPKPAERRDQDTGRWSGKRGGAGGGVCRHTQYLYINTCVHTVPRSEYCLQSTQTGNRMSLWY